ncbi:hypothetical protein WJX77_011664 [Trebouxia sp. C0004]
MTMTEPHLCSAAFSAHQHKKAAKRKEPEQQEVSAASVHAQANAFPHQVGWELKQARLSPSKKKWLLEMIWATDREPEDYKAYDLTDDEQVLQAFEGCVGQEPHSAWEMYKEDEAQ